MNFYYPGYIDPNPSSGSQVRLNSVLNHFNTMQWNVISGSFFIRQVKLLQLIIRKNREIIYFETASYPFFVSTKKYFPFTIFFEIFIFLLLSKFCTVRVYYRDAHWSYPQFKSAINNPIKYYIYKFFYLVEKLMITYCAERVYVPSKSFGIKIFSKINTYPLPPAIEKLNFYEYQNKRLNHKAIKNSVIYVGGISNDLYDITETVSKIMFLPNVRLLIVSRSNELNLLKHFDNPRLQLKSLSNNQFENASLKYTFFLCGFAPNAYMDMALPVKLFKCLELGLIPLYSGTGEISKLLAGYHIGLNLDKNEFEEYIDYDVGQKRKYLGDQQQKIKIFVEENSWEKRLSNVENNL
jgi:hypothetical protein